ncbi:UNVERIFIED_CONTAM: hypothetical protein Sradi_2278800 [Sesamum radiatum]|uniref:Uncharacterized protein n=1 Tax=Sesamum radiatum TaxID=300843 RepID=A0AAW2T3K7_SESRA
MTNKCFSSFTLLLLFLACVVDVHGDTITCYTRKSPCFLKQLKCPAECPSKQPTNSYAKVCHLNCNSPICKPECKSADGTVFYFHGQSNHHFTLVSDPNLHINARFIGLRPVGRQRDFTWIQALGILFDAHTFSVEATKARKWDQETDHLKFSYDGQELPVPSVWESPENKIKVERTSEKNSVVISLPEVAEISINVVPVTEEDDRIHNYRIPSDDCFAHLEVQFRFYGLSGKVEGVLGRTYQPDFVNPAKLGVTMPVVGGEDKYRTSSLLATDCALCVFSRGGVSSEGNSVLVESV